MREEERIKKIIITLKKESKKWQTPVVDLIKKQTKDPFKILVATIISARTRDEVTGKATEELFKKIRNPKELSKLREEEIARRIYPAGFYKTKAKNLKKLGKILEEKYEGRVPETREELMKLPGVGRKTANLVLARGYNKKAICVDTHVHRISNRLGIVKTKTPIETEKELMKKIPKKYWQDYNTIMVSFGQSICKPISPKCEECPVRKYCKRIGVKEKKRVRRRTTIPIIPRIHKV